MLMLAPGNEARKRRAGAGPRPLLRRVGQRRLGTKWEWWDKEIGAPETGLRSWSNLTPWALDLDTQYLVRSSPLPEVMILANERPRSGDLCKFEGWVFEYSVMAQSGSTGRFRRPCRCIAKPRMTRATPTMAKTTDMNVL